MHAQGSLIQARHEVGEPGVRMERQRNHDFVDMMRLGDRNGVVQEAKHRNAVNRALLFGLIVVDIPNHFQARPMLLIELLHQFPGPRAGPNNERPRRRWDAAPQPEPRAAARGSR